MLAAFSGARDRLRPIDRRTGLPRFPATTTKPISRSTARMSTIPTREISTSGTAEPPTAQNEIVQSAPIFALRRARGRVEASPAEPGQNRESAKAADAKERSPLTSQARVRQRIREPLRQRRPGCRRRRPAARGAGRRGRNRRSPSPCKKSPREEANPAFAFIAPTDTASKCRNATAVRPAAAPAAAKPYHVPAGNWDEEKAQQEDKAQKGGRHRRPPCKPRMHADKPVEISAGEYTRWMLDSHFHALDLTKLKLKPGSLLKDFQEADVGFAPDGMLIVLLAKKGGSGRRRQEKARHARRRPRPSEQGQSPRGTARRRPHFLRGGRHASAAHRATDRVGRAFDVRRRPGLRRRPDCRALAQEGREVQSAVPVLHAVGVPAVLQDPGRVLRPARPSGPKAAFRSRTSSPSGTATSATKPCGSSRTSSYYKDDPGFKLKVIGYKCAGCGLVVSEESREKEKHRRQGRQEDRQGEVPEVQKALRRPAAICPRRRGPAK